MTHTTRLTWTEGMSFAAELNGHSISLDADSEFGGQERGPRPKGLVLVALGGCTGMDVVSLLKKMRVSYDDFRIKRTNLLEKGNATTAGRMVPYTVFIDPQLGRVGLSEKEAKAKNIRYKSSTLPMNWVARALEIEESRGFMKVLVEEDTGQILGCAVLGIEGGEIMAMIQTAIMGKLHYSVLQDATFAHPTLAESLNNLFAGI